MIPYYTFDTETRGLFGKIFRWRLYDGETLTGGYSGDDAVVTLMSLPESDHVYIHNLEFDLAKLLKSGLVIDLEESRVINRAFATAKIVGGPTLHCSWHIMRSSLKSLSQSFELGQAGKLDLSKVLPTYQDGKYSDVEDFFNRVPAGDPLLNEYLDDDVISLHLILKEVIEFSGLEEKFYRIVTTPQLSMNIFKTNFKDDYEKLTSNQYSLEQEGFFRDAYIGADTQMFTPHLKGTREINGYHYDVNSLYPFVMEAYSYPSGTFREAKGRDAVTFWDMIQKKPGRYKAAIASATVIVPRKEKYPTLPTKIGGKLMFCVGEVEGTWTLPELNYALSRGAKIKDVSRVAVWKNTESYFKNFVAWAKEGKLSSRGGKRQLYKDMMNAFYGKLGMSMIRENYLPDTSENRELFIAGTPIHEYEAYGVGKFIEGFVELKRFTTPYVQPHIAAYVTAYARLELIKQIHREESLGNTVYYCDTDSLVVRNKIADEFVHEKEFGKWKLEGEIREGIYLEPKLYAEKLYEGDELVKGKGIPRRVLDSLNFGTYENMLTGVIAGEKKIKVFEGELRRRKIISGWKTGSDLDSPVTDKKTIDFSRRQKRNVDWQKNKTKPWDYALFREEEYARIELMEQISEKKSERDQWMYEHNGAPSLWWAIKHYYGGIKKTARVDYPHVPGWMIRRNGRNLDEMVGDYSALKNWGFFFDTADELYQAIIHWKNYQCP